MGRRSRSTKSAQLLVGLLLRMYVGMLRRIVGVLSKHARQKIAGARDGTRSIESIKERGGARVSCRRDYDAAGLGGTRSVLLQLQTRCRLLLADAPAEAAISLRPREIEKSVEAAVQPAGG